MRGFSKVFMIVAFILAVAVGAAAETTLWIPAAASNPGRHGTQWTTDLWISNPVADASSTVYLAFFPDQEGVDQPAEVPVEISRLSTLKIIDVVSTLFGEHRPGAIRLRSEYLFDARSRTANTGGDQGSYGQAIPAVGVADLAWGGTFPGAANIPGAAGVRTNLGLVNSGSEPATFVVFVQSPTAFEPGYGWTQIELGPGGWWQGDVFEAVGADGETVDDATVTVLNNDEGVVMGYLSRIDNASGDGTYIAPITNEAVFTQPLDWELEIELHPDSDQVSIDSLKVFVDGVLTDEVTDPGGIEDFTLEGVIGDLNLCFSVEGEAPSEGDHHIDWRRTLRVEAGSSMVSRRDSSNPASGTFEFENCDSTTPPVSPH